MAKRTIRPPILVNLVIAGYGMYPGCGTDQELEDEGEFFEVSFDSGVSVIAGINGIGKTTLLTMIRQLLLGPMRPKKSQILEPGKGGHELVIDPNRFFFRERVEDGAVDATVLGKFRFGDQEVAIERSLVDLSITKFWVGKTLKRDISEENYRSTVNKLSGVGDDFDFDFLVRHICFFLEERSPLIWNRPGQFEALRILFLEKGLSREIVNCTDSYGEADSNYRNLNWNYNKTHRNLEKLKSKTLSQAELREMELKETVCDTIAEALLGLDADSELLQTNIIEQEDKNYRLETKLEEIRQSIRNQEESLFASVYPETSEILQQLFSTLLAGSGCQVCGAQEKRTVDRIRSALASSTCPLCDSPPELQERLPTEPFNKKLLAKLKTQLKNVNESVADLKKARAAREFELVQINEERRELRANLLKARLELDALRSRAGITNDKLDSEYSQLNILATQRDKFFNERAASHARLAELLESAQAQIQVAADEIVETFGRYATEFLGYECFIEYTLSPETVAQSTRLMFPIFSISVESGGQTGMSERRSKEQVSESQKELIDLAFRISILNAASARTDGIMLVIETPEASLDSIFVESVGNLVRDFAQGHGTSTRPANTVIASCNVTTTGIIQSLLGLKSGNRQSRSNIEKRVVNLLELGAPGRVYDRHKDDYDSNYAAIFA